MDYQEDRKWYGMACVLQHKSGMEDMKMKTYQTGTWETKVKRARELEPEELEKHAMVSINNRHICKNCFTCACAKVYRERPH